MRIVTALLGCAVLIVAAEAHAQRGRGGPPATPRAAAAADFTG